MRKRAWTRYTPEMKDFIKEHCPETAMYSDICDMVNARFGTNLTAKMIKSFMWRNGIVKNPRVPVGSEGINGLGYVEVKIAMSGPNGPIWKLKHRLVWEKAHGAIPEGCVVAFLDGDNRNFSLNNLVLLTRAENLHMHKNGFFSKDRDVTLAGIAVVKHLLATHTRLEKMLGLRGHRNFICRESRKRRLNDAKRSEKTDT
jgi:hypothetical protein